MGNQYATTGRRGRAAKAYADARVLSTEAGDVRSVAMTRASVAILRY
jgi:hypothetical protein